MVKDELKASDMTKNPIVLVNFVEKYSSLKADADVHIDYNNNPFDQLLKSVDSSN